MAKRTKCVATEPQQAEHDPSGLGNPENVSLSLNPDSPDGLVASQYLRQIYILFQALVRFRPEKSSRAGDESRNPRFLFDFQALR